MPQGPLGGSANMVDTQGDKADPEYTFTVKNKKQEKIEEKEKYRKSSVASGNWRIK